MATKNTFDSLIRKEVKRLFEESFAEIKSQYENELRDFLTGILNEENEKDSEENLSKISDIVCEKIVKGELKNKIIKKMTDCIGEIFGQVIASNKYISHLLENNRICSVDLYKGLERLKNLEDVISTAVAEGKLRNPFIK